MTLDNFVRTLWSSTTCEFCGRYHNKGVCPKCGADRSEGNAVFVESPKIEKQMAINQLLTLLIEEEEEVVRLKIKKTAGKYPGKTFNYLQIKLSQELVLFSPEDELKLDYISRIVHTITGEKFVPFNNPSDSFKNGLMHKGETLMLSHLKKMQKIIHVAIFVEEKIGSITGAST